MLVDRTVHQLAGLFVADTLDEVDADFTPEQREAWVQRAAEAMQRAIEDACAEIAEELKPRGPGLERDR